MEREGLGETNQRESLWRFFAGIDGKLFLWLVQVRNPGWGSKGNGLRKIRNDAWARRTKLQNLSTKSKRIGLFGLVCSFLYLKIFADRASLTTNWSGGHGLCLCAEIIGRRDWVMKSGKFG